MSRQLFITCVSPDRPHPSGRLALKIKCEGVDVFTLFENARSILGLFQDANKLLKILRTVKYSDACINVNGSIAQATAVVICRLFGLTTKLWIMDSYPGCLRYVTPLWALFYPIFFIASFIAKQGAQQVLIIDEAFTLYAPSWGGFRSKCIYTPLPQEKVSAELLLKRCNLRDDLQQKTIGILGNIEQVWLKNDFKNFHDLAQKNGFHILIATSNKIEVSKLSQAGVSYVVPWPKSETERVFAQCSAILVPLSVPRLIYSSPSKIIDCYLRGIQPVVMTDMLSWNENKNRIIYQKCVHISEFFSEHTRFSSEELEDYSRRWVGPSGG